MKYLLKPGTEFINFENKRGIIINIFTNDKNKRKIRLGIMDNEDSINEFRLYEYELDEGSIVLPTSDIGVYKKSFDEYFKLYGVDEINNKKYIRELSTPYPGNNIYAFDQLSVNNALNALYEKINEVIRAVNTMNRGEK